jgi:rhomboid protease GluP
MTREIGRPAETGPGEGRRGDVLDGEVLGPEPGAAPPQRTGAALPLHQPRVTYVLLGLIGLMFLAQMALGGSENMGTLIRLGAQVNPYVAAGEYWRLIASMFLHIGLPHLLFNAWALFSIGRDIEMFYGPVWFTAIYFISGLAGNIAFYCLGSDVVSAGASGAIFGLIGAEAAFFLVNRQMFGSFARQRLGNLAIIIGINLVFGFTAPGINNLAHLGGLVSGFLLGYVLAPKYAVQWQWSSGAPVGAWQDSRNTLLRVAAVALAFALLFGGLQIGNARWGNSASLLGQQAIDAMDRGDLATAQQLLEEAVPKDPQDTVNLANLGIVYLRLDRVEDAVAMLEKAQATAPADPEVGFYLGTAYAQAGRTAEAKQLMQAYLDQQPQGELADMARQVLGQ